MRGHAEISGCGSYRYLLERSWGGPLFAVRILIVCMLNPSKADALVNDATVRWWIGWCKKHDYGALRIVNMAAYRATSPADMLAAADPHGAENTSYLIRHTAGKDVVCAWGSTAIKLSRYQETLDALGDARLHCLATNKDGPPGHPLRRPHSLGLRPWATP